EKDRHNPKQSERQNCIYAKQITPASFADIAPPKNCGKRKKYQRDGKNVTTDIWQSIFKCCNRQACATLPAGPKTRGNNNQSGHSTNNDGIDKGAHHPHQARANGTITRACRLRDSGRPQTRFVGKYTARDAIANCCSNCGPGKASGGGNRIESMAKNQ